MSIYKHKFQSGTLADLSYHCPSYSLATRSSTEPETTLTTSMPSSSCPSCKHPYLTLHMRAGDSKSGLHACPSSHLSASHISTDSWAVIVQHGRHSKNVLTAVPPPRAFLINCLRDKNWNQDDRLRLPSLLTILGELVSSWKKQSGLFQLGSSVGQPSFSLNNSNGQMIIYSPLGVNVGNLQLSLLNTY